jgi:branched-chain amino acid transport system permease protein
MNLDPIILQLLTGLQLGAVFILVALGLTLIFGTLGIANFSHGSLYLIGAYIGLVIAAKIGWVWAILLVPFCLFVVGIIFDRLLLQYFYKRPVTDQILVTFGLALIVQEVARWIFGGTAKQFNIPTWAIVPVNLGNYLPGVKSVYYPPLRLLAIAITIVAVLGLFMLLRYTRFGLMVRAGMRDPEMVRYLGINSTRTFTVVVGLGALLAGIAGVMGGSMFTVSPEEGMLRLVPAFLVVVIGGMGSIIGAVIAGLVMGFAQTLATAIPGLSPYSSVVIYFVAVIVLSLRPRGFFGMKGIG